MDLCLFQSEVPQRVAPPLLFGAISTLLSLEKAKEFGDQLQPDGSSATGFRFDTL
jgi:hypothetical protein